MREITFVMTTDERGRAFTMNRESQAYWQAYRLVNGLEGPPLTPIVTSLDVPIGLACRELGNLLAPFNQDFGYRVVSHGGQEIYSSATRSDEAVFLP
jgi:hypothetical protein